jgi:hypothetical protein
MKAREIAVLLNVGAALINFVFVIIKEEQEKPCTKHFAAMILSLFFTWFALTQIAE